MDSRYKQLMTIGGMCLGALLAPATHAESVPWTGTANYTAATGATGDEDTVGPINSYDFSSGGMVLIRPVSVAGTGFTVGDTYSGFYQSAVTRHMLGTSTVASPNLNTTGSGSGYELTIGANFNERVVSVDTFGNPTFEVTGGNASIYFDTTPDQNANAGPGFTAQVTGVLGNQAGNTDLVLTADGNLDLLAVPLPAPLWLLGVALAGLGVVARRGSNSSTRDDNSNGLMPSLA